MRSWIGSSSAFARVVTITHERTHASGASGSGIVSSRQISHSPANASGSPSRRCTRYGWRGGRLVEVLFDGRHS